MSGEGSKLYINVLVVLYDSSIHMHTTRESDMLSILDMYSYMYRHGKILDQKDIYTEIIIIDHTLQLVGSFSIYHTPYITPTSVYHSIFTTHSLHAPPPPPPPPY